MSQGQGSKLSPSTLPSRPGGGPVSPSSLPSSLHPHAHHHSPAPSLPSIRNNPALFRPDPPQPAAAWGGGPLLQRPVGLDGVGHVGTSASGLGGLVGGAGGGVAGPPYQRLPPIDLSQARSRQGSVVGRSAPPSRQTSVEPDGEDELASPPLAPQGKQRKRTSSEAGSTAHSHTPAEPGSTAGTPAAGGEQVDWTRTRKDNHKEVERRRRETINDGINDLKAIVPGCEKNKGSILQRAVEYINELKGNEARLVEKWTLEALIGEWRDHCERKVVQLLTCFGAWCADRQAQAALRHELDDYKRHSANLELDARNLRLENERLARLLGQDPAPATRALPLSSSANGLLHAPGAGAGVGAGGEAGQGEGRPVTVEEIEAASVPAKRGGVEEGREEKRAKVE